LTALLALPLVFLSCEKTEKPPQEDVRGMYGVYPNFLTKVRIVDSQGNDLLDKSNERHYTSDDIDVIEYIGKHAMTHQEYLDITWRPGDPILDNKKGYAIFLGEDSYFLSISFRMKNMEDQYSTRHLRIGKDGKIHAIKGEGKVVGSENDSPWMLYGGGKAIVTERVWLDGKLIWEADRDNRPLDTDAVVTIVVED